MEWKVIPSFPLYEASRDGKVRNIRTGRILAQHDSEQRQYKNISLYNNKKKYTKKVARLIYETFNGCACKETINHKDRNPTNNHYNNLECITMKQNIAKRVMFNGKNKYSLTEEDKRRIVSDYRSGKETTWTLQNKTGVPMTYLQMVFKRGSWDKLLNGTKEIQRIS